MTDKLARGIWPALVTPFTDDGSALAPERVAPLIGHLLEQGSQGFFVCGGTGEGIAMSVPERKAMAEASISAVSGQVPLILQVGATATDNAVALAQHAAQAGADAVASVAPIDRPNDLEAAVAHYAAIGAASDLPFYIYWLAYNIMPKIYVEMRQCFEDGGIRQAMDLQDRANQVIATLFRFGILGGIKALLSIRRLPVGPPRLPHTPLDEAAQTALQEALDELAFAVE